MRTNSTSPKSYIPDWLRIEVATEFEERCAYCQSPQDLIGAFFEVDHIMPQAKGGKTIKENLCWCCPLCNRYKRDQTMAVDPQTQRRVKLFHPRKQRWTRHFKWNDELTHIIGRTMAGRATVEALKLNNDRIVPLRRIWVSIGRHPSN